MKLFISYARVDRPYCVQIIETLSVHDCWYDGRMYGGDHWWSVIQQHLEWCEGFIYLLSAESIVSTYCRQEYELAKALNKVIIPILIQPNIDLPEDLQEINYIDLSEGLTAKTVSELHSAIIRASQVYAQKQQQQPVKQTLLKPTQNPAIPEPEALIEQVTDAMDNENYDQAVFLLQQAKIKEYEYIVIDLDEMLQEANAALEWASIRKEAEREYRHINTLVHSKTMHKIGCRAFAEFNKRFPQYDPDNIAAICGNQTKKPNGTAPLSPIRVPRLDLVNIPAGQARIEISDAPFFANQPHTETVPAFRISRYPITNAQFQLFLNSPDGYCNQAWWDFSKTALAWRQKHPKHPPPRYRHKNTPRETVTWYSAMAFVFWLSYHYHCKIRLPQLVHWQRAVQGEDNHLYPWGDDPDPTRCNTHESRIGSTTPVNHYPNGVSPYDVWDLVGNCWEWTIDSQEEDDILNEQQRIRKRAVVGGSHISPLDRSQVGYRFYLHPKNAAPSIGFRVVEILE